MPKKSLAALLVLALVVFAGCGSNSQVVRVGEQQSKIDAFVKQADAFLAGLQGKQYTVWVSTAKKKINAYYGLPAAMYLALPNKKFVPNDTEDHVWRKAKPGETPKKIVRQLVELYNQNAIQSVPGIYDIQVRMSPFPRSTINLDTC